MPRLPQPTEPIPEPIEVIRPGAWPRMSYSSATTLGACEKKYHYRYIQRRSEEPTSAMSKGSLFHRGARAWWTGGSWEAEVKASAEEWVATNPEAMALPDWISDAGWLLERYAARYETERDQMEVVGTEVPFRLRLPGRYAWLVGSMDMVVRIAGRTWVVEIKTMSDWDRLEAYCWDPQLSLYYWAATELDMAPWGILLEGARTYRWKNPRPVEESFQRRWLDRSPDHIAEALADADAVLTRSRDLANGARPMRNVSRDCNWCPYREPCREELAFGPMTVEWEE
jgi:PD-(D/E)XK nuclease superfamily protein